MRLAVKQTILFNNNATLPSWLSGNIPAANCIAAYRARGAANAAASYINLANPGTYDLTVASVPTTPPWNTVTGWSFDAVTGHRLFTGITPGNTQARTAIVRFTMTDFTANHTVWGERASNFYLQYVTATDKTRHENGGSTLINRIASGVIAIAGGNTYLDGVDNGDIATGTYLATHTIHLGCYNNGGTAQVFHTGTITDFYYYDITLTPAQVAAVTASLA